MRPTKGGMMSEELSNRIEKLLEVQWAAALQYTLAVDMEINDYAGGEEMVRELWEKFYELVKDRSEARKDLHDEIERAVNGRD